MSDKETVVPEISEEQNYQETVRDIRSFIEWYQVPEFGRSASSQDDNSFASLKTQPTSKKSIKLPSDDWLFRKMEKLNLTMRRLSYT